MAESIRFSSRFMTSATVGFQPAALHTRQYVTHRINVMDHGPGHLSQYAIDSNRAMEDIRQEIIDANLSESVEHTEIFANICDLNESLAAEVKYFKPAGSIQDGLSMTLVAAH